MTIVVHETKSEFSAACERVRQSGRRLGLVPTMGALHEGHLRLVDEALRHADEVAVSVFVNPTQFGPNEDYSRYPRTLERDVALCKARGVALVFAPDTSELYPKNERTRVQVSKLSLPLCGAKRPGHFDGVATVVTKLFAVAGRCVAVFGKKDYQQLKVIERMSRDLCLPVEIVGHPIVREESGLALSSRNQYLSDSEKEQALALARGLSAAVRRFAGGERRVTELVQAVQRELRESGVVADYVELVDPEELEAFPDVVAQTALLAVAAFLGKTRLIDNVVLGLDPAPLP